jgi:hypothetical protein
MLWKQLTPGYRRLLRDGQRGDAVVVSVKTDSTAGQPSDTRLGAAGIGGTSAGVFGWNLTIRVKFEDGTTADHERYLDAVQHGASLRSLGMAPWVGMILPVRFDQGNRSRVEIDTAALRAESQEVMDGRRAAEDAAVQQAEHDVRPLGQASQAEAASTARGDANSGDQVEQLQKLADLHDRGVLTDAEFADQKAKILGEG